LGKCCKDEISILKPVLQRIYDYRGKYLFIETLKWFLNYLTRFAGHSILMVFEKVN